MVGNGAARKEIKIESRPSQPLGAVRSTQYHPLVVTIAEGAANPVDQMYCDIPVRVVSVTVSPSQALGVDVLMVFESGIPFIVIAKEQLEVFPERSDAV
jgi:hypothetical protein